MKNIMLFLMPKIMWSTFAKVLNPFYDKYISNFEKKHPVLIGKAVRHSIRIPIELLEKKNYSFDA
jgi:hypothetical protein